MGEATSEGPVYTKVRGAQEKSKGMAWPGVNAFRCWGNRRSSCLYVQWGPVGRRIYRPDIDTVLVSLAWAAIVMMVLSTYMRNTRVGPSELPFEYVQVEVLGDKVRKSREQIDMWIKLFLSDPTIF